MRASRPAWGQLEGRPPPLPPAAAYRRAAADIFPARRQNPAPCLPMPDPAAGGDAASLPAPGESALPAAAAPPRSYSPVAFPRLKVTASPFASASLRRSNGSPVPASPHSCASDGTPFAAAAAGLAPRQRQHFHCAAPQPAQQQQQQVSLRCFSPPPAACSASRPSQGGAAGSAALAWVAGWNCLAQAMGCAAPTPPASAWMQPHATTTSSRCVPTRRPHLT